MHKFLAALALALLACPTPVFSAPPEGRGVPIPETWTLEQALDLALESSPSLRLAKSAVDTANAGLTGARVYPYNPEFSVEAADRSSAADSTTDRGFEISQEVEIAGQRRKRSAVARSELEGASALFRRDQKLLAHRIKFAFSEALAAEQLVQIASAELELVERLLEFESRRLDAGAGTQVEINQARAAAGKSRQTFHEALARRSVARVHLAEVVGVDPGNPPRPVAASTGSEPEIPDVGRLVDLALSLRADFAARRQAVETAERNAALQKSLAMPNLRLGVFQRREEGDDIAGATIGISIPLFDRNQGGIARAAAESGRVEAELAVAELEVRAAVIAAHARLEAARRSVGDLETLVVGTLEDSLRLLEESVHAGKISVGEVLLQRRELIEAQRRYTDALRSLGLARADLELAAGVTDFATHFETDRSEGANS